MKISSMLRVFLYLSIVILTAGQNVDAQDRSQGRSMVISRNGIVAAESPLAAQAGVGILERGGEGPGGGGAAKAEEGGGGAVLKRLRGGLFSACAGAEGGQVVGNKIDRMVAK